MIRLSPIVPCALITLTFLGCSSTWEQRSTSSSSTQNILDAEEKQHAQHSLEASLIIERQARTLGAMDERLAVLEQLLRRQGRGAYRHGPSLSTGESGGTLLNDLHQLEELVNDLRSEQQSLSTQNQELRQRLSELNEVNTRLRDQLEILRDADSQLVALQQERHEALRQVNDLRDHLTTAEVERLRSERRYFDLIREVITIKSDETQRLMGLQSRLRGEAAVLRPNDLGSEQEQQP